MGHKATFVAQDRGELDRVKASPDPNGNRAQRRAWAKLARLPLGRRNPADIQHTLLRVVGKDHTPALEVAAFQSFTD